MHAVRSGITATAELLVYFGHVARPASLQAGVMVDMAHDTGRRERPKEG